MEKFGVISLQRANHQKELIKNAVPWMYDKNFSRHFSFSSVLLFTAESFFDFLSYYWVCGLFCAAKEIFPPSLSSAMISAVCDGWAYSSFSRISVPLHFQRPFQGCTSAEDAPFPSSYSPQIPSSLSSSKSNPWGCIPHSYNSFPLRPSHTLLKLRTDSEVKRYRSSIYCNVFDKKDVTTR